MVLVEWLDGHLSGAGGPPVPDHLLRPSTVPWATMASISREHGIDAAVIVAIALGEDPPFTKDDERTIHSATSQLGERGRIDVEAYASVQALSATEGWSS